MWIFCALYYEEGQIWTRAISEQLRHCATSQKVAGSIPEDVIGIFHWHNPSGHTVVLVLIQSLKEKNNKNISWGKDGRCLGLTTLPLSCADCLEIWEPQPPGTLWASLGLLWDCFTFLHEIFYGMAPFNLADHLRRLKSRPSVLWIPQIQTSTAGL